MSSINQDNSMGYIVATVPVPTSTSTSTSIIAPGLAPTSTSASTRDREKEREREREREREKDGRVEVLPHPAEDLSADDDLLSWVLVDQLGCMPNTKLGVHPQQVKFVGPPFKTEEVLNIVKETITKGNDRAAMQRLQEFPLFKSHIESKMIDMQRDRFIQHLRRYLLPLKPESRVEIHLTSRYSFLTGHTELAVFATKPLAPPAVMSELQGSVVPLPEQWRQEMEIGEDFAAVEAAGEETDSESEDDDNASLTSSNTRRDKGKGKEAEGKRQGQRRSDRTKRRDFSIVWSGLKRCYQLFLGPARFLNHDCNPNVELLRQGKHVTFRVIRPIRIGEELTTFYGENYFGRGNIECLCLTCEQSGKGGFTPVSTSTSSSRRPSRANSRDSSAGPSRRGVSPNMRESVTRETKSAGPSALRNVVNGHDHNSDAEDSVATSGPSQSHFRSQGSMSLFQADDADSLNGHSSFHGTPTKRRDQSSHLAPPKSPTGSIASELEPEPEADPLPRRDRVMRKAVQNMKPWQYLQRPTKLSKASRALEVEEESADPTDDLPSDFPRCATCAKPLTEQIWFNGRYFDHCARCVRHALIFELPWPAHSTKDVQEYPPVHLVPSGYIPRRISTIPLPTLSKAVKPVKAIILPASPKGETRGMRRARTLRAQIEAEEFFIESLREAAWSAQEAQEAAVKAEQDAKEAAIRNREEEKRQRLEAKRLKDVGKIKGTGVWQRYAYLTEEEVRKKEEEKNKVLSGTRRGGRFRAREEEEEMKRLAEEKLKEERALALELERQSRHDGPPGSHPDGGVESRRAGEDADDGNDEEEVAAAPELTAIPAPWKPRAALGTAIFTPSLPYASPSAGSSTHKSTASQASPIIDLTLSDGEAEGDGEGHNSFESSASTKRKRGRPKGSGKHQKRLAKQQAALAKSAGSVSGESTSTNSDGIVWVRDNIKSAEKGKEKAQPSSSPLRMMTTLPTNDYDMPDSPLSSHANREKLAGPSRANSARLRKPPSTSVSSAAAAERSGVVNGNTDSNVSAPDQQSILQTPKLILNFKSREAKIMEELAKLNPNMALQRNGHTHGNTANVARLSNGESASTKEAERDRKRKRVSDLSETSGSPTTATHASHPHPEKKKRTFFPPIVGLSIANPISPFAASKH